MPIGGIKMNRIRLCLGMVAAVIAFAASATPAAAQIWIGQMVGDMMARRQQQQCLSGTPLPPNEIAEARVPALEVMRTYWERVAATDAADVRPTFHQRRRAQWKSGEAGRDYSALSALNDPLGRLAGAAMESEPVAFVRAGDGGTARGLWRVSNAGSAVG